MLSVDLTAQERKLGGVALAFAVFCLALEFGAAELSSSYGAGLARTNSELTDQYANIQQQLSEIVNEERQLQQFVEKYQSFDQEGLVKSEFLDEDVSGEADEEMRLAWLSRLQEIRADRKFFKLNYELTAPIVLDPSFSVYTQDSTVVVRANTMRLSFPMLHEMDMLMLINDFYNEENNRFVSTQCSIDRITQGFILNSEANLSGSCEIIWLTVFDPDKKEDLSDSGDSAQTDAEDEDAA